MKKVLAFIGFLSCGLVLPGGNSSLENFHDADIFSAKERSHPYTIIVKDTASYQRICLWWDKDQKTYWTMPYHRCVYFINRRHKYEQ